MFQIKDTLVTLDMAEQFFCCDLEKCLGACCIEGDAGAPVTEAEVAEIEKALPVVEPEMMPRAEYASALSKKRIARGRQLSANPLHVPFIRCV